jgi:hypothetical protein
MAYFKNFQKVDYDIRGNGFTQSLTNLTHFSKIGTKFLDDVSFYSYYTIAEGERPDMTSYKLYGTTEHYWTLFIINQDLYNAFRDWPKATGDLKEYVEEKYSNLACVSAPRGSQGFERIAGKFKVGEQVIGGVSDAIGIVVAKNPTLGYVEIQPVSGTFKEDGEGIYGIETQDFLTCSSITKMAYAPRYWVDDSTGEQTMRRLAGTTPYTNYEWEYDQNLARSKIKVIKPRYIEEISREFRREMQGK